MGVWFGFKMHISLATGTCLHILTVLVVIVLEENDFGGTFFFFSFISSFFFIFLLFSFPFVLGICTRL